MLHKIILSTFGLLTLATCKNQNSIQNSNPKETTEIVKETKISTSTSTPKDKVPEMSTGLPPDNEAIKQAEKEQNSASVNKNNSEIIYFKEGQNQFLKEYEMNVTFKGITEDSRCPKEVNCIWQGVATAEIVVMGLATRPMTLKISTANNPNKGLFKTQSFNGYIISMVSISPETTSEKGFKALKGNYKIGLHFEKETSSNTGTTTK
jgi:hypothetical protein